MLSELFQSGGSASFFLDEGEGGGEGVECFWKLLSVERKSLIHQRDRNEPKREQG